MIQFADAYIHKPQCVNRTCNPGGHYWNRYTAALSCLVKSLQLLKNNTFEHMMNVLKVTDVTPISKSPDAADLCPISRLSLHYSDVIMGAMASQITSPTIVYSTVYSGADQGKHQSPASQAFVREFTGYRWKQSLGIPNGAPSPLATLVVNSSPPRQNGRQFGRRHFQMHFHE